MRFAWAALSVIVGATAIATGSSYGVAAAIGIALLVPGVFAVFSTPLLFPYGLYVLLVPFDNVLRIGQNVTLTRLLGMVAGAALLGWCLRKGKLAKPGPAVLPAVAILAWMLLSVLWSRDQQQSLHDLAQYAGLVVLFVALALMPIAPQVFRNLFLLAALAGVSAALYGIYLFHSDPGLAGADPMSRRLFTDSSIPAIDPNAFADAMLLPFAALLTFFLQADRLRAKILYGAGISVVTTAVLLAASREAAIALAVMLVYVGARSRHRVQLFAPLVVMAIAAATSAGALWARFAIPRDERASIWAVGFEAFKHSWLAGYGVGTFPQTYDTYYLRVAQGYSYGWSAPPHNLLVQIAVELGAVGIVLLGWFLYNEFRQLRDIDPQNEYYDYRVSMEAALIGLTFVSMFIGLFTYKYAWLTFAMAVQLRNAVLQGGDVSAIIVHDGVPPAEPAYERTAALA